MLSRRGFLGGLLAAPAIVRAGSLMPVKALPLVGTEEVFIWNDNGIIKASFGPAWIAEIEAAARRDDLWRPLLSYSG